MNKVHITSVPTNVTQTTGQASALVKLEAARLAALTCRLPSALLRGRLRARTWLSSLAFLHLISHPLPWQRTRWPPLCLALSQESVAPWLPRFLVADLSL